MRQSLILVGLALVMAGLSWAVAQKESLLANGERVYLELAPVDPRSLMQGDYMQLRYRLAGSVRDALVNKKQAGEVEMAGRLVLRLDTRGVASFTRIDHGRRPLDDGEVLLRYKQRKSFQIGAGSFFFQEGTADIFDDAKYGELRVDAEGGAVLIGLRDAQLQVLGADQRLH